jgi:predicted dehydrogenase
MNNNKNRSRRNFIKNTVATAAGVMVLPATYNEVFAGPFVRTNVLKPRIRFAVIGINHGHIHSMVETMINAGGECVSFFARENELAADFKNRHAGVKQAKAVDEILGDGSIQLVVSASIPDERAPLGIRVMKQGKDFLADKPGILTLEQLQEVKKVQQETKRIYAIFYGERLENKATVRAGELVKQGAIGKVIQTIGMGPHRLNAPSRPDWFFRKKQYGGILVDIATHQCDQFLYFTGSTSAEIVASQVGNFNHPQYSGMEDFGDALVRGNGGTGYMRVDWFTPDGLNTWGDTRLTILGTEGYIEVRKNADIGGRQGANHLFLVDQKETRYINCEDVELTYGRLLVDDIVNRTETAMTQEHCFLAAELAIKAQQQAKLITPLK